MLVLACQETLKEGGMSLLDLVHHSLWPPFLSNTVQNIIMNATNMTKFCKDSSDLLRHHDLSTSL